MEKKSSYISQNKNNTQISHDNSDRDESILSTQSKLLSKALKIEGIIENNLEKIEILEASKIKNSVNLEKNIFNNKRTLESNKKKTEAIFTEFNELKARLENQNKKYETEILNKKQEGEKVNYFLIIKNISNGKNKQKFFNKIITSLKSRSEELYQNLNLLEEDYKTQQNMLINHTSKFESLNFLLNQITIRRNNISEEKINVNSNAKNFDNFNKESNYNLENVNSTLRMNKDDSIDSLNSKSSIYSISKKKKSIITKFDSNKNLNDYGNTFNNNNNIGSVMQNTGKFETFYKNPPLNNKYLNENDKENKENSTIESNNKIELDPLKSFEFLTLDIYNFSKNLLEKLSNGKNKLNTELINIDYLKSKFSKIVELVKFSANSKNITRASNYETPSTNSLNNSSLIENATNKTKNFQKIKSIPNKNQENFQEKKEKNLNNIGIDEKFLLDLIIKEIVLNTGIKYEILEKIINLLIKINYINFNIKLRENFLNKEFRITKNNLMDKILNLEKRIEIKYEKLQGINIELKRSDSKTSDFENILKFKKKEFDENLISMRLLEGELKSLNEIEDNTKIEIQKSVEEKNNLELDYENKINLIEVENKSMQKKLQKINQKLKFLNERKNFTIEKTKNFDRNEEYFNSNVRTVNELNQKFDLKSEENSENKFRRKKKYHMSNGNNNVCIAGNNSTRKINSLYSHNSYNDNYNNNDEENFGDANNNNDYNFTLAKNRNENCEDEIRKNYNSRSKSKKSKGSKGSKKRKSSKSKSNKFDDKEFKVNNNIYTKYEIDDFNKFKETSREKRESFNSYNYKSIDPVFRQQKEINIFKKSKNKNFDENESKENINKRRKLIKDENFDRYKSSSNSFSKGKEYGYNLSKKVVNRSYSNSFSELNEIKKTSGNNIYRKSFRSKDDNLYKSNYVDPEVKLNLIDKRFDEKYSNSNDSKNNSYTRRLNYGKEQMINNKFKNLKKYPKEKSQDFSNEEISNFPINQYRREYYNDKDNDINNTNKNSFVEYKINDYNNNNESANEINYNFNNSKFIRTSNNATIYRTEEEKKNKSRFNINTENNSDYANNEIDFDKKNINSNANLNYVNQFKEKGINCYKNNNYYNTTSKVNSNHNLNKEIQQDEISNYSKITNNSIGAAYAKRSLKEDNRNSKKENLNKEKYQNTNNLFNNYDEKSNSPEKNKHFNNDNFLKSPLRSERNINLLDATKYVFSQSSYRNFNRSKMDSPISSNKNNKISELYSSSKKQQNFIEFDENKNTYPNNFVNENNLKNNNLLAINKRLKENSFQSYNTNTEYPKYEKENKEKYNKFNTLNYSNNDQSKNSNYNSGFNYKQSNSSNTYFTTNKFNSFNDNNLINSNRIINNNNNFNKEIKEPQMSLLNLNYKYTNTEQSNNSQKINHTKNFIENRRNKTNTNSNYISNDNNINTKNFKDDEIEFNCYKSDSIFENKNDFLSSHKNSKNAENFYNNKNKFTDIINTFPQEKDDFLSNNEQINKLEKGCLIFKRNNFISKNKVQTSIFYSNVFNPLDYGFNEHVVIFDRKRNKLTFNKKEDSSSKSDIYIASLTSVKIPQYTKNLLFVKQVYKKFKNNFSTYDEMDDYINNNSHFLVNLYYDNNTDKNIKFDNRLYSRAFRRDLLENENYVLYLNLISENARIEIMFRKYEEYKMWKKGLEELVSLRSI